MVADPYRVIVADDEAGIRELMRTLLSLEPDFEVVGQAGDGVEAVELVSALHPDLVVIDISMPVMDGLEAISRIRKVSPATRVAVLSGERLPITACGGRHAHREGDAERGRRRHVADLVPERCARALALAAAATVLGAG